MGDETPSHLQRMADGCAEGVVDGCITVDGASVGCIDGRELGRRDGRDEGCVDGQAVGRPLGCSLGVVDG